MKDRRNPKHTSPLFSRNPIDFTIDMDGSLDGLNLDASCYVVSRSVDYDAIFIE